jgi:hypothetical protein
MSSARVGVAVARTMMSGAVVATISTNFAFDMGHYGAPPRPVQWFGNASITGG